MLVNASPRSSISAILFAIRFVDRAIEEMIADTEFADFTDDRGTISDWPEENIEHHVLDHLEWYKRGYMLGSSKHRSDFQTSISELEACAEALVSSQLSARRNPVADGSPLTTILATHFDRLCASLKWKINAPQRLPTFGELLESVLIRLAMLKSVGHSIS